MRACMHTYIHTYIRSDTLQAWKSFRVTDIHIHTPTYIHLHTKTPYTHAYMHTYIHTYAQIPCTHGGASE